MRSARKVAIAIPLILALSGCDKAKSDYDACVAFDKKARDMWGSDYTDPDALAACRNAVRADPDSSAGKAAAKWIADQDAAEKKRHDALVHAAVAAQDALLAKYRALSADDRKAHLENCFGPSRTCTDVEKSAIIAAASDSTESAALKQINDSRTPTAVSFDQLKKLAETGMTPLKPYKVCAYYYPNDMPQFCKYNGKSCDAYVSVDDDFAVGSDEKKALYDRRDKTGCFEVMMFVGGNLRITGLL